MNTGPVGFDFKIDKNEFEKNFKKIMEKSIPGLIEKALVVAGWELKLDADNVEPRTPHREGILRGSGKVEKPIKTIFGWSVKVGYNVPYAAYVHEGINIFNGKSLHYSEQGCGAKYLESKMIRFKYKYMEMVADYVKGGGK